MSRRRFFVVVGVACVSGAGAWLLCRGENVAPPRHLKPDDVTGAAALPEDSPFRIHQKAYDEVRQLQQVALDGKADGAVFARLMALTRYREFEIVRARACHGLGYLTQPEFRDQILSRLVECLGDHEGVVKICACQSLASLDAKNRASAIIPLLNNPSEYVRRTAKSSLEKMGIDVPAAGGRKN